MGARLRLIGWGGGLMLSCGGSDRVTLGLPPDGAAGVGGMTAAGAAGTAGAGGSGGAAGSLGSGGSTGGVREGSPSIGGLDAVAGGSGLDALDAGSASGGDAADGSGADAGSAGPGGTPGAAGAGAVAGSGGSGGGGGAAGGSGGAAGAGGGAAAGDLVAVNLEPSSLALFAPPIDSSRYAVAGYDAAAGVCVSIIWDYSNNDLELGRHCDDFGEYVNFPYVLVEAGPAAGCLSRWGYVGLEPSVATGCIDPVEGLVNVRLEVEAQGIRYAVRAVNDPGLVGP